MQPAQEAGEKVYEAWSRPSVEVTAAHQPLDSAELGVSVGDTASVLRKSDTGDQIRPFEYSEMFVSGWYYSISMERSCYDVRKCKH